ncbi:MAG: hypothetical protein SGBAC_002688 [Bacillariaceae sp.]
MSWGMANAPKKPDDYSLSFIQIMWMAIVCILLMVPKWRRRRDPRTIRDFIVQSVLMTKEEIEDRKKYLEDNLKTHKVVVCDTFSSDSTILDKDPETALRPSKIHKGDLILLSSPMTDSQKESDLTDYDDNDDQPMCAICVASYEEGDEICWSNNHKCQHCFHKECIQEWLLLHEECPFCRLPFLPEKEKEKEKENDSDNAAEEEGAGSDTDTSHGTESIPDSGSDDDDDDIMLAASGRTEVTEGDGQHSPQENPAQGDNRYADIELGMSEANRPDDHHVDEEASPGADVERQAQHC